MTGEEPGFHSFILYRVLGPLGPYIVGSCFLLVFASGFVAHYDILEHEDAQ